LNHILPRKLVFTAILVTFYCWGISCAVSPLGSAFASPSENAIIEAARIEVERQIGRKVLLKVVSLRSEHGWAFLFSRMLGANGDPLDLTGTMLERPAQAGTASRAFCALLKQEAGKWRVVTSRIGVTDVAWSGWDRRYGAPSGIFEMTAIE